MSPTPPAYRIETRRLLLRPWDFPDVPQLHAVVARNQAHLGPWLPWAVEPPSRAEYLQLVRQFRARYDRDEDYVLGALRDGVPIGGTGLHKRVGPRAVEIGYWIDQAHEGQGYVTEWVAALCRVAFEVLGVERIDIHTAVDNLRSSAVPRRLGFRDEGVLRKRGLGSDGSLRDTRFFTLEPGELTGDEAADVRAYDALGQRLL